MYNDVTFHLFNSAIYRYLRNKIEHHDLDYDKYIYAVEEILFPDFLSKYLGKGIDNIEAVDLYVNKYMYLIKKTLLKYQAINKIN